MIRRFFMLLGLAIACGGVVEDDSLPFEDDSVLDEEFGTVEQAFNVAHTDSTQFGTQTGSNALRANRTSSGQVFAFLQRKGTIRVCVEQDAILGQGDGFSNADASEVYAGLGYVDGATSAYTFDYASAPSIPGFGCSGGSGAAQNSIVVRNISLGTSTATNSTSDYGRPSFQGLVNMTEGAGVVGQAQSADWCIARVSLARIKAKGANASEDQHHIRQATSFAASGCLGMGGKNSGANSNKITATTLTVVGVEQNTYSAAETCQLTNFTTTANGQYNQTANCGND